MTVSAMLLHASLLLLGRTDAFCVERPNIIVIMADDMGYADAGFTGCQDIQTPNLDELAASGVTFTQGYVNHPFCAPSRAALLSGRYHHRFGFEDNPAYDPANPHLGIDAGEKLLPQRLKEVGYITGIIGKWHLGAAHSFHPLNRGFDYFYGFLGGGHDYYQIDTTKPALDSYYQPLSRNRETASFEGYLTTALSGNALHFIETNRKQPFFLFLSYNAPHAPLQAPEATIKKYAHIKDDKRRVYAAMVDVMDQGIGQVIKCLVEHGLRENTLIFFLSDNGGPIPMSWGPHFGNGSDNTPFRGGKTNMYDGGIHVPFIASWPTRIAAGTTFTKPVIAIDIARTAAALAGADAESSPAMEGVNLMPFACGDETGAPHDVLFWRDKSGKRWAVLDAIGNKYVLDIIGGQPELFHLPSDQSESNNVIADNPEVVARLRKRWDEWNQHNIPNRIENYLRYRERLLEFYQNEGPASPAAES